MIRNIFCDFLETLTATHSFEAIPINIEHVEFVLYIRQFTNISNRFRIN